MRRIHILIPAFMLAVVLPVFTACDDMLDMGNSDVLYADNNHLTEANDSVNSYVGILAQLQKIAVRTNLFGELRADLVSVESTADADLKAISTFTVDDDNAYNAPRDYYAVINNCNYFLANADTALRENRYIGGMAQNVRVFQAEYCAVRAVRAWLYLQLGQIYGTNIPVVTTPILSLDDADAAMASATKMDLAGLCQYFIDDLLPYVSWFDYPYHGNKGYAGYNNHTPSRMTVFPVQLVLGDLYLWLSSIRQDKTLAREAAKCYYDYIDWTPVEGGVDNNTSYKHKSITGYMSDHWSDNSFTNGDYLAYVTREYTWFSTTSFGGDYDEVVTVIAMDSASSEGHFNQLRYLYSWNQDDNTTDAVIVPAQPAYDYSDSQVYLGAYLSSSGGVAYTTVSAGALSETLLSDHCLGDLRLPSNIISTYRGDDRHEAKGILKISSPQDIIIYRRADIYLRLAEALCYAGFPKFALSILTTGLDNTVIRNPNGEVYKEMYDINTGEVNTADSTFIWYFNFPTQYYKTRVSGYSPNGTMSFVVSSSADNPDYNQIGLHTRGSGFSVSNPYYYSPYTDVPADSTGYPVMPPLFTSYDASLTAAVTMLEQLTTRSADLIERACSDSIVVPNLDEYDTQRDKRDAVASFAAQLQAYADSIYNDWEVATNEWNTIYARPQVYERQMAVVDSLIDVEQALETAFEGRRFGDLMRAAYRRGDPTYLADKVAKRDPSLQGRLSSYNGWFISWKGMIGQ